MKARRALLVFISLPLILAACAAPSAPRSITDAAQRVESNGFSVLPPKGANWYIEESPYGVAFYKRLPPDTLVTPTGASVAVPRTYFVLISLVNPRALKVHTTEDLKREMERTLLEDPGSDRKIIDYKITPYSTQGTDCVRYVFRVEERNRPFAPGAVLNMPGGGFMCLHPLSAGQAIHGTFSERRLSEAKAIDGETHQAEGAAVLDSILFGPLR
jgi:hypothetical protein